MESPPLLIRRDAQRKLSLAIAWFLGVPAFALGFASILWPLQYAAPDSCPNGPCPRWPDVLVPPFLAPGIALLTALAIAALVLYRLTYRRERLAWTIVAVIGAGLVITAVAADATVRLWEVALLTFVWPMAPGLMAIDAARHSHAVLARMGGSLRSAAR